MSVIEMSVEDVANAARQIAGRFYETISKFEIEEENGERKVKVVQLLVKARDITESEKITMEELTPQSKSPVVVTLAKESKYKEALTPAEVGTESISTEEKWYSVKVNYITVTDSGKNKKTPNHFLFLAHDVQNAHYVASVFMMGSMADWEMASIVDTKIEDVIK